VAGGILFASGPLYASSIAIGVTGQLNHTAPSGVTSTLTSTQSSHDGNPAPLTDSVSAHGATVNYNIDPTAGTVGTLDLSGQTFSHTFDFFQTNSDAQTHFSLQDSAFVNGPLSGPLSGKATMTFHGSLTSGTVFQDSMQAAVGYTSTTAELDGSFTTMSSQFAGTPVISSAQHFFYDGDACGGTPDCSVGGSDFTTTLTTDWTVSDLDRQIDLLASLNADAQNGGSFVLNSLLITFYLPPGTFLTSSGHAFVTGQTVVAATPIPGSVLLFASALVGLGLMANRRRQLGPVIFVTG
jgi:hypothetical protein